MVPVATLEPPVPEDGEGEPELTPIRKLPKRRKDCRWEEVKAGLVDRPGEVTRLYSLRPTSGLDDGRLDGGDAERTAFVRVDRPPTRQPGG